MIISDKLYMLHWTWLNCKQKETSEEVIAYQESCDVLGVLDR